MVGPLRITGPANSTGFLAVGAGQTRRDREYSDRHSINPMHFIAIVYVGSTAKEIALRDSFKLQLQALTLDLRRPSTAHLRGYYHSISWAPEPAPSLWHSMRCLIPRSQA